MSNVINFPAGYTVKATNYDTVMCQDMYNRSNQVESSILPCIYNGFQIGSPTGLDIPVTGGSACGQPITYTVLANPTAFPIPTVVTIPTGPYTISCPDNSTGYIVLNINIYSNLGNEGPLTDDNTYIVNPTDINDVPPTSTITPVFIDSGDRQLNVGSVYPYTQIVLAQVTTSGGNVTSILTDYNSDLSLTNRSFDFQNFYNESLSDFTTGDIKYSANLSGQSSNWLLLNNTQIGSPDSGAFYAGNYYNLYNVIWSTILDQYCPVSGGRGVSAAADYAANKTIALPQVGGRSIAAVSSDNAFQQIFTVSGNIFTVGLTTGIFYNGTAVTVFTAGGVLPTPLLPATTYYVIVLSSTTFSLAATPTDVNDNVPIVLSSTGTPQNFVKITYDVTVAQLNGGIEGQQNTQLLTSNLGSHTHPPLSSDFVSNTAGTSTWGTGSGGYTASATTGSSGNDVPHNNMQPTIYLPAFIHI